MSNNAEAVQQEEVSQQQQAANDQLQPDTETAKQATPVKQQQKVSVFNMDDPEESRDSVVSAEGDEKDGADTNDKTEAVAAGEKTDKGHAGKNGDAAAKEAEVNAGDAKTRKRSNIE